MATRVVWTEAALDDLEAAAEYIEKDSPRYASALVAQAFALARSLSHSPGRGHIVPELGDSQIREVFLGSFRLVYLIREWSIDILGFIHGARDLRRAMQDRE